MDALVAILACSLHHDDVLVRAIVDNVHDNPFSVLTPDVAVDPSAPSPVPRTLDAAVAQLTEAANHGQQPLVGLMQVPVAWAAVYGREARELFDPCVNVSIGTAMLSEFDYACARSGHPLLVARLRHATSSLASRRVCVLRRYAEALRMPELVTVVALSLRYRPDAASEPSDASIFGPPGEHCAWGSDCLFVRRQDHSPSELLPNAHPALTR